MLSDREILEAIRKKLLIIEPFDEQMLRPACINLRLGNLIFKQVKNGTVINPFRQESMNCYKEIRIDEGRPFILKAGEFILASTYEKIGISKTLGALLDGTSTLARLGISVTQTAAIVDTGHGWSIPQHLTLEIKNNGLNAVELYYRMKIARIVFFRLAKESSFGYAEKGKYVDGSVPPKPIRMKHR